MDLSPKWLFVLKSVDPQKMGGVEFGCSSNSFNEVSGRDFDFYMDLNQDTDLLTLHYKDPTIPDFRVTEVTLRDYGEGVLRSNTEITGFIGNVAAGRDESGVYQSLKAGTAVIDEWYPQRYGIRYYSG